MEESNCYAFTAIPVQRMVLENIAASAIAKILIEGCIRNDAWSFGAARVYLASDTTATLTTMQLATACDQAQRIGITFNTINCI